MSLRRLGLVILFALLPSSAFAETHEEWTRLLETYVSESDDGVNRVDYAGLKNNAEDLAALDTYIAKLAQDVIPDLPENDADKFAAWSNLYNAITVRLIIDNYPVDSIRDIKPSFISTGPWKKERIEVDGQKMSLDDIEHGQLRVHWSDPRVHYAVNCASFGCPNLLRKAWVGETLDEDLDAAARDYVNNPRGVSVLDNGDLEVSKIYKWYREDFGGSTVGIISHLIEYAEPELKQKLTAEASIDKYVYDWSLNEQEG